MNEKQNENQTPKTSRIEAFSDGVFAIVITLLVLELRVPKIANGENWYELITALLGLIPQFVGYVMSFFFVAVFWIVHHQFFHTLDFSRRGLLWLNNLFLFFVTFIPFPTALLGAYYKNLTAVIFFGLTFFLTSMTFAVLRWYAWTQGEIANADFVGHSIKNALRRSFLVPLIYLVGIGTAFFSLPAAIIIYFLTPLLLVKPMTLETKAAEKDDIEV